MCGICYNYVPRTNFGGHNVLPSVRSSVIPDHRFRLVSRKPLNIFFIETWYVYQTCHGVVPFAI